MQLVTDIAQIQTRVYSLPIAFCCTEKIHTSRADFA